MNQFKERLLKGEKLIGFEVDLAEPCISEMVAALVDRQLDRYLEMEQSAQRMDQEQNM